MLRWLFTVVEHSSIKAMQFVLPAYALQFNICTRCGVVILCCQLLAHLVGNCQVLNQMRIGSRSYAFGNDAELDFPEAAFV